MHGTFVKTGDISEIIMQEGSKRILPLKENNVNDSEDNGHYLMIGQWLCTASQEEGYACEQNVFHSKAHSWWYIDFYLHCNFTSATIMNTHNI